ncbi:MAG: tyrosine-type recombinase/integrase [Jhaorihella sp.]
MRKLQLKNESFQYIEKSFREWLDILGYAESTVYNLPNHIRELFYYLEQNDINQINELNNQHIKDYYNHLKLRSNDRKGGALSNGSLNKHLQALYKFTDYLRQSGRMLLPTLNIEWEADDTKHIETLTVEEIQQLYRATRAFTGSLSKYKAQYIYEAIALRDCAMLTVFYGCGARRNEGYHLNIDDIDFDRQVLHIRKGKANKERLVPFNKTNARYLQEYVYDSRPILLNDKRKSAFFINERGNRLTAQSMSIRLKILQQRTDDSTLQEKNVRLHVLRHSIATHLLQNGMPLENISRFLGHNSLESTQVYTHLINQDNG